MCEYGLGRDPDMANAIQWYREGADHNNPDAQNNLGRIYETGKGVPVDYQKAIHYYTAAAEQDHSDAVTNLGK